ncbi:hypothetical protein [Methanobrevibacter sp.]|uniref:hypothetical protein n=1 Tax=Methanobrevibacter sp. TaxID=66852 RepID=UPI00388D7A3F
MSYVLGYLGGMVVGAITANLAIGVAVGAALGALIGTAFSAYINSEVYDVNYNRLTTCLNLIIGTAAAGAAGGFWGTAVGQALDDSVIYFSPDSYNFNTVKLGNLFTTIFIGSGVVGSVGGISYYYTND